MAEVAWTCVHCVFIYFAFGVATAVYECVSVYNLNIYLFH